MDPQHPDSETLLAFREHRLSGAAVAEAAAHIGRCARCAKVEPAAGRRVLEALVSHDEHLSDAEMDVLIDRRADDPSHRVATHHVAMCAMCRAEVEDLRRFDDENVGRASARPDGLKPVLRWLIAAGVGFLVVMLGVLAFRRPSPAMPQIAANPPAPVAPVKVAPPAPKVVASLADGGTRIELREDGTLSGVALQSPKDGEDTRAVLSGHAIAIPTFIAAMPGAVRGGGSTTHPLRTLHPFRSAVRTSRPRFSWTAVPGARGYRVTVFDANYEEIARSEPLTATSWTPTESLPTGVDLSWLVVADTESGELSSAGPDRAEAVFRVLSGREMAEVERDETAYRDSHLLRGLLYSRHGLLHEAGREFRRLAEQNPGSPVARDLIDTVRR